MASSSRSKLRVQDRISGLPDSLLCHILSFLPTKKSVRTSILSWRWKRVWASVPSLDFDERLFPDWESFVLFVSRVLYFRDSSNIQKLKLNCCSVERFSHFDGWIRAALMKNLTELDLCVERSGTFWEAEHLLLPKSVFMCKTLVILKLRLLSGCPALEDLAILGTVGHGYLNLNVSALELKELMIYLDTENTDGLFADYTDLNVLVSAPKLKKIDLQHNAMSNCVLKNLKSLVEASIDLVYHDQSEHPAFAGRATALLASFCNVESLFLSSHGLHNCEMPVFGSLTQLEVTLHRCSSWWANLLESTPLLEVLVLNYDDRSCDGMIENELVWHPPEVVPKCLLSLVKTIHFDMFKGKDFEYEVAK